MIYKKVKTIKRFQKMR